MSDTSSTRWLQHLLTRRGIAFRVVLTIFGFVFGFGLFITDRRDQVAYSDYVVRDHAKVFEILDEDRSGSEPSAAELFGVLGFREGSYVEWLVHAVVGDPPEAERERLVNAQVVVPLTSCLRSAIRMMDAWRDVRPAPDSWLSMSHAPLLALMGPTEISESLGTLPEDVAQAFAEGRKAWIQCPDFLVHLRGRLSPVLPHAFLRSPDVSEAREAVQSLVDRLARLRQHNLAPDASRVAAAQRSANELEGTLLRVFRPTEPRDYLSAVSQDDIADLKSASDNVQHNLNLALNNQNYGSPSARNIHSVGELLVVYAKATFIPLIISLLFGPSLFVHFYLSGTQPGSTTGSS